MENSTSTENSTLSVTKPVRGGHLTQPSRVVVINTFPLSGSLVRQQRYMFSGSAGIDPADSLVSRTGRGSSQEIILNCP